MAKFDKIQKMKLEKLFEMESGYVLDFSNQKFQEFLYETVGINIYDDRYSIYGESKAKRLRAYWEIENDYKVKKLILALIEYKRFIDANRREVDDGYIINTNLIDDCIKIANSLNSDELTEVITELERSVVNEEDVKKLLKSIRENIENHDPELALDRLHTYCVKYVRGLCDKYEIPYNEDKPLHSCFGEYVKYLVKHELIETKMTKVILRNSISIFDEFNFVRNRKSFAHDNEILNYEESLLIFRCVTSVLDFIESIEIKRDIDRRVERNFADSLF